MHFACSYINYIWHWYIPQCVWIYNSSTALYAVKTFINFGIFVWLCLHCIHFNIDVIIINLHIAICALYNWALSGIMCTSYCIEAYTSVHTWNQIQISLVKNIHSDTRSIWFLAINHLFRITWTILYIYPFSLIHYVYRQVSHPIN